MLDLKEERKFKQLRKLGQELHIPIPEAFLMLEVFDKDGKLLQRNEQRSHSWVRNAYNAIFSQLAGVNSNVLGAAPGAGTLFQKKPDGAASAGAWPCGFRTNDLSINGEGYGAPAGEDTWGIVVGSGLDAESFEDFVLQTLLDEGTGAGQISHVASQPYDVTWVGGTLTFGAVFARYFNNNSAPAGDRDVNEVALYARLGAGLLHCMARDHLAATVTVPSTGQLKVTYTIQLTYPA